MLPLRSNRSLLVVPVAATVGAVLSATPAFAHAGQRAGGWSDGLVHPVSGVDHLLAMVAVGIVAATMARQRSTWMAPVAFLAGMGVGGLAGVAGVPIPAVEQLIVASVVLLGLAMAGAIESKGRWLGSTVALLALAGAAHGHAHGAEAPASVHPAAYLAGFLVATACLHGVGVGIGTIIRDRRTLRLGMGLTTATAGLLLVI